MMNKSMKYINYNREERDICAHLFHLLLEDQPNWGPLKEFLSTSSVSSPRIFCEVALLRDAYHVRKPNTLDFVDQLCKLIAQQNNISSYTMFRDLPTKFTDPKITHPKDIRRKLKQEGLMGNEEDSTVYGSLQAMFNAKPDLAVCIGNEIIVYEAKFTLGFDNNQLIRTGHIGEAWATLLYSDLGFAVKPTVSIKTLGLARYNPDVSWERVLNIAKNYWGEDNFSIAVLSKVLQQ